MNGTSAIWARLLLPEDGLTERKLESASDFKETVVAFANSVPQGSEGVLFVGIADKTSEIRGCKGVDSLQKTISRICLVDCYPPIPHRLETRELEGKVVLAVIIPYSAERPHFSGHAFRRIGSQTMKSDEATYSDFIVARSSVGAKIVENSGRVVLIQTHGKRLGDPRPLPPDFSEHGPFTIEACDPHTVTLKDVASGRKYVEQIENISISYGPSGQLLLLVRDVHSRP